MSGISSGAGSINSRISEISKNVGTGPTKLENDFAEKVIHKAKEIGQSTVDTIKNGLKTPEGKALAAVSILVPGAAPIIAGTVVGKAAAKSIENNHKAENNNLKNLTKVATSSLAVGYAAGAALAVTGTIGVTTGNAALLKLTLKLAAISATSFAIAGGTAITAIHEKNAEKK